MATSEQIADSLLRHTVLIDGFSNREERKIKQLLVAARSDVRKQIASILLELYGDSPRPQGLKLTRLRKLEKAIDERLDSFEKDALSASSSSMQRFAVTESAFYKDLLFSGVGTGVPPNKVLREIVDSKPFQGKLLKEWYSHLSDVQKDRVKTAIRMGVVQGESVPQVVRRVRQTFDITERQAAAIVRTSINHVTTQSKNALFQENAELLRGVQMLATLDSRTTPYCRAIDLKIFPVNEGPRPPFHFGCRTTIVPIIRGRTEAFETRSSKDGYVDGSLNYKQWFKRQSAGFQREVLGPSRYKLFSRGLTDVTRYANREGRLYTLDELYKREAQYAPK